MGTESTSERPLRLWPGVLIVVIQWLARFVLPVVAPDQTAIGMLVGLGSGLLLILWWLFFSRAPWSERLGGAGFILMALWVTSQMLHESMATGAMGMLFLFYAVPTVCLAFVVWAFASRKLVGWRRGLALVVLVGVASGGWVLVKTGGFTGNVDSDLSWRWSPTAEDRLLRRTADEAMASVDLSARDLETRWSGFRGTHRDGQLRGVEITSDWSSAPPVELWRREVGPAWSSFAVAGGLIYTQEQRGEEEVVSCYRLDTGEPVWRHGDQIRFWESNAGAGPRATPTIAEGHVFTLGATGVVNALDAIDGSLLWSRDAAADTGAQLPSWGFSGSPLVFEDLVVVAASGSVVAYSRESGDVRWIGPSGGEGYSSPHLATIDGAEQVLQLHGEGIVGIDPATGAELWTHTWDGFPMVQPAILADGNLLVSISDSSGTRRLSVARGAEGWIAEEVWTTRGLKPNFNDFVVHDGHAYGFDGRILASIGLDDGERRWKGGRYGNGQLILLAQQDLLLVISEKGELALVRAAPEGFEELARFPALKGKTWNHPVLVGDTLLVRNGREMAALRLSPSAR